MEFRSGHNAVVSLTKLGGKPEITRCKGLGEISPAEFKQFIGKDMRVSRVEYAPKADSAQILSFCMGKNTPERKDQLRENLESCMAGDPDSAHATHATLEISFPESSPRDGLREWVGRAG